MASVKRRNFPTAQSRLAPSSSTLNPAADSRRGKNTAEPRSQRQRASSSSGAAGRDVESTAGQRVGRRVASDVDVTDRGRHNVRRPHFNRHVAGDQDAEETNATNGGQEVKFTDVPSESGAASSERPTSKCQTMSPQEILKVSQEPTYTDVYEVNLHACNISAIPNLDKFTNLRLLDLSCNSIRQIANLHHNKSLKELKLYGNEITTVSNLERLVELHTLQLQHNRIQTVGPCLSSLKKLKVLRLDSNRLRKLDSREIASCSQLTVLDISSNKLDALNSLNCLSSLEELHATHNGLRAVTDLSRCKKLNEVNLSHNKLSDLTGLRGLPHITILHLSHNSLTTSCLKALGKLRSLQILDVSHNQMTELIGIHEQFPSLEVLSVSDNRIQRWTSVCSLDKCSCLSELYVSGNPFCAEQGEKPSYHHELQGMLPKLDILDGIHMKRNSSKSAPVMRPMSVASALSSRQVENQLKHIEADLASLGASLAARFESARSTMESLPPDPPSPRLGTALSIHSMSTSDGSCPGSRCNSRSRILEAQAFATENF